MVCLASLAACGSAPPEGTPFVERSYVIGQEYSIGPGEEVFTARTGERFEDSVFVGLLYGGTATDTWEEDVEHHTLTFQGVDGDELEMTYAHETYPLVPLEIQSARNPLVSSHYGRRLATPGRSVFRDLKYPNRGREGVSQAGIRLEVLEITAQSLRYRIIEDNLGAEQK